MKEQDYLDIEASTEPDFAAALAERRLLNNHLHAEAAAPALRETLEKLRAEHFSNVDTSSLSQGPRKGREAGPVEAAQRKAPEDRGKEATVIPLLPRKNRILLISLAAAIILLLVFGGRVFFNDQGTTYEQFAQHQPLSLTERGEGDNGITLAEAAFNGGQYSDAIAPLKKYLQLNRDDARARLALGISYLETNKNAEAVRVLTEVAENGGAVAPYGNWYLALAALHRGDNIAATRYLELIPPGDAYLDERVIELRQVLAE